MRKGLFFSCVNFIILNNLSGLITQLAGTVIFLYLLFYIIKLINKWYNIYKINLNFIIKL